MAEPEFLEGEGEELAEKVKARVEKNFLKGASIGINILKVEYDVNETPVAEVEILECSVVDIPSNANAIVLFNNKGEKLQGEALKLSLDKTLKRKSKKESSKTVLEDKLKAAHTAKVDALISNALSAGKFTADKKESFTKLANTDFELAVSTINSLEGKKTLTGKANLSGGDELNDRSNWSFEKWRKEDTQGLLAIKKESPERYAEILKK